jgi:signal peptide peptidase SppA
MKLSFIPFFDQYFGYWAIETDRLMAMWERARGLNLHLHMESGAPQAAAASGAAYGQKLEMAGDGIAVVRLEGTLMKQETSGEQSTSTVQARRQIRQAANDTNVKGILLHVDSPGGTVAGTQLLADDIKNAAAAKPLYAQVEDLCASAAYWLSSQAQRVFANATAQVGSIGTYGVVVDSSGQAAMDGVKVYVVKAGEFKGAGIDGVEVTPAQLAEYQNRISALNDHFVRGVAAGRGMTQEQVRNFADGRVFLAGPAMQMGLIDGVQSLDETISQLSKKSKGSKSMNTTDGAPPAIATAPVQDLAATLDQLELACIGATHSFILEQLRNKATVGQAMKSWMGEQSKLLEQSKKDLETAKAATPAPASKKSGVKPLATGTATAPAAEGSGDFNQAVKDAIKGGKSRAAAVKAVARANPELHRAYLEETNPSTRARTLIADRFEQA